MTRIVSVVFIYITYTIYQIFYLIHIDICFTISFAIRFFFSASQAYASLEKVLLERRFLADVSKMSTGEQTASLEAFHSLIIHFAPKHTAFSWLGMRSRYYLFPFLFEYEHLYSLMYSFHMVVYYLIEVTLGFMMPQYLGFFPFCFFFADLDWLLCILMKTASDPKPGSQMESFATMCTTPKQRTLNHVSGLWQPHTQSVCSGLQTNFTMNFSLKSHVKCSFPVMWCEVCFC